LIPLSRNVFQYQSGSRTLVTEKQYKAFAFIGTTSFQDEYLGVGVWNVNRWSPHVAFYFAIEFCSRDTDKLWPRLQVADIPANKFPVRSYLWSS